MSNPSSPSRPRWFEDYVPGAVHELGTITVLVPGDWGHLPQKMADDLTEATRTEAAPEYRAAIESYYKAIAQKAKK